MYVWYKKYDVHFISQYQKVIECVIQKSLLHSLGHKIYKKKQWLTLQINKDDCVQYER